MRCLLLSVSCFSITGKSTRQDFCLEFVQNLFKNEEEKNCMTLRHIPNNNNEWDKVPVHLWIFLYSTYFGFSNISIIWELFWTTNWMTVTNLYRKLFETKSEDLLGILGICLAMDPSKVQWSKKKNRFFSFCRQKRNKRPMYRNSQSNFKQKTTKNHTHLSNFIINSINHHRSLSFTATHKSCHEMYWKS